MARYSGKALRVFLLLAISTVCSAGRPSSVYTSPRSSLPNLQNRQASPLAVCAAQQPTISAPHKNIWLGLTDEEATSVINLLHRDSTGLNLTAATEAGSWDNQILSVDLLTPNKTDVLPFLNSNATVPKRYARATLTFGATPKPYLQEYVIGPLPVNAETKVQPLEFPFTNEGKGKVFMDLADGDAVEEFLNEVGLSVANITTVLWGGTPETTINFHINSPPWKENGRLILWAEFVNNPTGVFDTFSLLPLGLSFGVDITGRDPSKWSVIGWFYNGIFYPSTDEFRAAASAASFTKLSPNADGSWGWTDRQGKAMNFDGLPPPAPIMPGAQRFSVDFKENYVEWMDFSYYVTFSRDTGMRLFDVKYKGKRILYELGLEEALAHYAGADPVQSGLTYFDSGPGLGPAVVSLVDGYDCPTYSTYLNVSYPTSESSYTQQNAICLFEFDQGYPIQRHSAAGYTSISKSIVFTMRSVSTVANYDYMFSYDFFLDGSMEVSVRASGYIQSANFAHNEEYGMKIHDSLSGSMHDHVMTYKADFDILGEKNSLQNLKIVPATVEYPWSSGVRRNTMKIERSFIENEDESKINWSANNADMYVVVNKDAKNKFGEYPGYRFSPSTSNAIHLTVVNSSNALNALNYADHHFYVTKQKDTETRAAHPYNELNIEDPLIDFDKFFDGESLDQEDIVVWFNLGMHHVPHTGDLPNTMFTTAHSAFSISPFNYLDGDPSRATSQQVRIDQVDGKVQDVQTFGSQNVTCQVDMSQMTPKLWRDMGTTSITKYPSGLLDGSMSAP